MQPDSPGQIQACALRVARLAADGSTPAGASNGYITKDFASLQVRAVMQAGLAITVRDACGGVPINFQDRDTPLRYELTLQLIKPDPELIELLTGASLLTSTMSRTVADGVTVSGSPTVTSATAAFTSYDVGKTITGTGIPGGATILSVQSATSVTMSANATASGTGVSVTVAYSSAQGVGNEAPALGVAPTDSGVSLEVWSKAVDRGGSQMAQNPWYHYCFPKTFWRMGDRQFDTNDFPVPLIGYSVENANWGNGPWNDYRAASPSPYTLARSIGWFRSNDLPAVATGYSTVPAQV